MKNKLGSVIGFERLNFVIAEWKKLRVAFESIAVSCYTPTQAQD
jgi:hypothetical protein